MHGHPPGLPAASARHRALSATLTVLLVLTIAACSGDDADDPPPATTTTAIAATTEPPAPTTTTSEPQSVEDEVEAAYLRAQAVYHENSLDPDPEDPVLAETRTGSNLDHIRTVLQHSVDSGIVIRFANDDPPTVEVLSVTVVGEEADLVACLYDNQQQVRLSDGAIIDDSVMSIKQGVTMRRDGGLWKVDGVRSIARWPDLGGCDR